MYRVAFKISLFACFISACQPIANQQAAPQLKGPVFPTGIYVGLEEMKGFPAEKPGDKWYHENYVYIRADSLFLEGNPVVISQNGEKGYSSSDGGFYSYSGRIDTVGGEFIVKLRMFSHDYIAEPIVFKDTAVTKSNLSIDELIERGLAFRDSSFYKKIYTVIPTNTGFDMDGVHYKPTAPLPNLIPVGFPDAKRFFKPLSNPRP